LNVGHIFKETDGTMAQKTTFQTFIENIKCNILIQRNNRMLVT